MPRILYLNDSLVNGGAERQMALLLKYLPPEWERRVWSLGDGPFADVIRNLGIRIDVSRRARRLDITPALRLWRILLEWKPEIVHSWGWVSSAMAGPACRALGIPLVEGSIRMGMMEPRRNRILKWNMLWATRVIVNSRAGLEAWRVDPARGQVVYNGFDPARLAFCGAGNSRPGNPFTAVMVGRMAAAKDYTTLVLAARELLRSDPRGWHFMAIGSGPDRPTLMTAARDLVDSGAMEFPEAGLEVLHHVRLAHAGVLMSNPRLHAEGCSNVIMEYMACGLPVICSEGGGNSELVVEGETGYLIPPSDAGALADRLKYLRDHPQEAIRMGAAGRARFDRMFSIDTMIRGTVSVYEELLRTPARR